MHENILKTIYHYHENQAHIDQLDLEVSASELLEIRLVDTNQLQKGLARLIKMDLLTQLNAGYQLTAKGRVESRRIVRLHRLWEQYLLKRTSIDALHVHSGAEAIEHILSPELEQELERELGIKGIPKEDF